MKTKIIFSDECLKYGKGQLESPERVEIAVNALKEKGYEFLEPELAPEKYLLLVHPHTKNFGVGVHKSDYLEKLKSAEIEDVDTPAYPKIYEYARLAAGGAILAAKVGGFSLMRPPGHHTGSEGAALGAPTRGFCYLNNIAIAVKYLGKPTLILDIDGHHGNGTEEIFFKDKKVIYLSLHREPFYPGTGLESRENCYNFPLAEDCGEEIYLKTLNHGLEKIDFKKIEIIAVSAGFDGHAGDLASLGLTEKTFGKIGKIIAQFKKHTFFVLEGGYIGKDIGKDIDNLLRKFEGF